MVSAIKHSSLYFYGFHCFWFGPSFSTFVSMPHVAQMWPKIFATQTTKLVTPLGPSVFSFNWTGHIPLCFLHSAAGPPLSSDRNRCRLQSCLLGPYVQNDGCMTPRPDNNHRGSKMLRESKGNKPVWFLIYTDLLIRRAVNIDPVGVNFFIFNQ